VERSKEIQQAGLNTALLCDSDDSKVNAEKISLKEAGLVIFDGETDKCIEQQIFSDLPWEGVKELLKYVHLSSSASFDSTFSENAKTPIEGWLDEENLRGKIVNEFKTKPNGQAGKKWFKAVHHGEKLGDITFKYISEMDENCHLLKTLTALSEWIDS
jgi:hypothetical protein